MQYRQLGSSGLRVSALTLGTMTFGGHGDFAKVGATDVAGARRQVDMCLDAGINLIDTADVYSRGVSEEIVGEVMASTHPATRCCSRARCGCGWATAPTRSGSRVST